VNYLSIGAGTSCSLKFSMLWQTKSSCSQGSIWRLWL